jgi:phosphocarrier protein HPr
MADETVTRTVVVSNPQGLHARPAEVFVKTASQYQSRIEVIKDGYRVDGKSILNILTLAAVQGTQLNLEATGPDAQAALQALSELFARSFDEGNLENNGSVES